jgi:hypothetical protein
MDLRLGGQRDRPVVLPSGTEKREPMEVNTLTAREDWDRVADSLGGLALKLKLQVEEASGGAAEETRSALTALGSAVEAAFDGLKAAIVDPAMKQDVRDVAAGFRDALSNTFAELSSQLRHPGDK